MKDLKQNYSKCSWKTQNVCCSPEAVLWCRGIRGAFWRTGAGLPWAAALFEDEVMSSAVFEQQSCFAESLNQERRGELGDALGGCADGSLWVTEGQCQSWAEGLSQLTPLQMDTGWQILMQFIEDGFISFKVSGLPEVCEMLTCTKPGFDSITVTLAVSCLPKGLKLERWKCLIVL